MANKPSSNNQRSKAFMICLLEPINNSICNATYDIENLLELLKKVKNTDDYNEALKILTDASNHQLALAQHLVEIVKSISIVPESTQKVH